MAGFYYYLPGVPKNALIRGSDRLAPEALVQAGIDDVLSDVLRIPDHVLLGETAHGPDGQAGSTLYPLPPTGDVPDVVGYDAAKQTWTHLDPDKRCWIGWLTDDPPLPADLERNEVVDGYQVKDAHEHHWLVPTLVSVDNPRGRLPAAVGWDTNREPVIGVAAKYRELWQRAKLIWDLCEVSAESTGVFALKLSEADDLRCYRFLCDCLQINYRVNNQVLAVIDQIRPDWLTGNSASGMLHATVDMFLYRRWLEAQKKTEG